MRVTFKPRSLYDKDRRPDAEIGGSSYEIKNPKGAGYLTVYNQVKSNIYGENKHYVNPQSDKIVISNVRSSMTMDKMLRDVVKMINREEGFVIEGFDLMTEILVVDKAGSIRRIKLK